jgi:ABC-2 type transport system permease protein
MRSHPQRIVQLFVWGTFDMFLWGFFSRYLHAAGGDVFDATTVLLGGILLWQFVSRVQQSFVVVFLEDIYTRNFLNIFSSPITTAEYVAGITLMALAMTVAAFTATALLAAWVFGLSLSAVLGHAFVGIMLLTCFGLAIGILAGAIVMRLGPSAEWFVWPIPAVVSPFVGAFYPISVLPPWMQAVSHLLPPSYAFEAFRASISGAPHMDSVIVPVILAVAYLAAALWLFMRSYTWALRTGAIIRYGAEES